MATQNKVTEMIASIKTIYPYYAKDTDVALLVRTWTVLLKDYPDKAVEVAFFKCLQTCKMPPTPADVIEQLNAMIETTGETDEELWSIYTRALREVSTFVYRIRYPMRGENPHEEIEKRWNVMPERLKQYIGSKGELMRMASNYTDEELRYERTRFFKVMPKLKKREEYTAMTAMLGGGLENLLIEGGGKNDRN